MSETGAETKPKGKPRLRSPEYPSVGLKEALLRAQQLYDREGFNWANTKVVLTHWGFGANSSAGMRMLAALRHFGLLEDQGDKEGRAVHLTDLSKKILRDPRPNSADRQAALREAALKPAMYQKLWKKWAFPLPSDASMAYELEHEFEFNPNSIPGFVADYKATLRHAGLDTGRSEAQIEVDKGANSGSGGNGDKPADPLKPKDSPSWGGKMPEIQTEQARAFDLPIPLGVGTATLRIPIPMSAEDFDLLTEALTMSLKLYKANLTKRPTDPAGGPSDAG